MSDSILMLGNCLESMKDLPDNSVDSIVTDPPYGLAFMGKKWDYDVPSVEIWREALRVLKPGGHLLSFGGTRTYHRLVVAIEDAGFEIRDQIQWIYGQGFPKSLDISKAIDKAAGAEREVIGSKLGLPGYRAGDQIPSISLKGGADGTLNNGTAKLEITAPSTEAAKQWSGWGTALKPANEPICLARKPLSEKTVAANVLKHGVGGLNIDGTRIAGAIQQVPQPKIPGGDIFGREKKHEGRNGEMSRAEGRFPANVIFDEDAAAVLDAQTGKSESRFFYGAKASKKDRGEGNVHPTVKPTSLMEYLIKLVTPEGGIVLDPFMGSGTTGVAAVKLGYIFIGCERDEAYFNIASSRVNGSKPKKEAV